MAEIAERSQQADRRRRFLSWLRNPLAMRLPLFDPDRFSTPPLPLVRPLFTHCRLLRSGWRWSLTGAALAALHWPELTANVADRVLAAAERA